MVSKTKKAGAKKGRVKVGKLKLNKETVQDLSPAVKRKIKGGVQPAKRQNGCDAVSYICSIKE